MGREKPENPKNPHSNRTDHRQDHGYCRVAHTTQGTWKQIHHTAKEIRDCGISHDLHTALVHLGIICIDLQDVRAKEISTAA